MKTLFTFTGIALLSATVALAQGQTAPAPAAADAGSTGGGQIDRKSTRLNSSHT